MTSESAAERRPRFYYGWIIILACNLVSCITWGVAIFNQGVFAAYWITEYGWPPAALAAAPAMFQLWAGVAGVFVGRMVDRRGPKPALLAGAAFICLALALIANVDAIWQVYPAFLLMGTGFACIHTVTLGKIVSRWFLRERARAMAAATFGAGIGGALLVPLNAWLIETHGPAAGCLALAAATLAVLLPMALFVVKDGPESLGLEIDGGQTAAPEKADAAEDADVRQWSVREAMGGVAFWGLAVCLGFGMLAQSAFLYHQTPFLQGTMGLTGAAAVVSVTTIAGLVGRVIFIGVGARLSTRLWIMLVFGFQALAFIILATAEGSMMLTVGSAMFGMTMGLVITLQPVAVAFVYGRESFGRIYGAIYMAIRTGAACGPVAIGAILALAGGYQTGWAVVGASLAVAILILPLAMRPPRTR